MCGMPPRLVCVGAKSANHAAAQTRSARGCALRVDHAEAQTILEDIEVTIAMEQRVLLADAVGCRQPHRRSWEQTQAFLDRGALCGGASAAHRSSTNSSSMSMLVLMMCIYGYSCVKAQVFATS